MLVAGIGNVFRTDDGFGPEVARRLSALTWPDGVRVVYYGIRGLHLAYDLLDHWDVLLLIDALPDRAALVMNYASFACLVAILVLMVFKPGAG